MNTTPKLAQLFFIGCLLLLVTPFHIYAQQGGKETPSIQFNFGNSLQEAADAPDVLIQPDIDTESTPDPPSFYYGQNEFFDVSGQWFNIAGQAERLNRLDIFKTIVNAYTMRPYISISGQDFPYPDIVKLKVSEEKLAYTASIAESECLIIPMNVNGEQVIKVYSLIVDAAGNLSEMKIDMMKRGTRVGGAAVYNPSSFSHDELEGYWIPEWDKGIVIPRLQISKEFGGTFYFKPYWVKEEQTSVLEKVALSYYDQEVAYKGKWSEAGIERKFTVRPLAVGTSIRAIDVIVEESYEDGTPIRVFRHFFQPDPQAEEIAHAEKLGKSIEDTWVNYDPIGATLELNVQEGKLELWVGCKNKQKCMLGGGDLEAMSDNMVGINLPGLIYDRLIEIDTDVTINENRTDYPSILVVNTTLLDKVTGESIRKYSEVFKRKPEQSEDEG